MKLKVLIVTCLFFMPYASYAMDQKLIEQGLVQAQIGDLSDDGWLYVFSFLWLQDENTRVFSNDEFKDPKRLAHVLQKKLGPILVIESVNKRFYGLSTITKSIIRPNLISLFQAASHQNQRTICGLVDLMDHTPLHWAICEGLTESVPVLLSAVGDKLELLLTMQDHDDMTALHWACQYGREEVVKLLIIAAGKNTQALLVKKNFANQTPLEVAQYWNKLAIVHLLTTIQEAMQSNDHEKVRELLGIENQDQNQDEI